MPNYSLVTNTVFNPFSYQELMAPVQRMSDYHEKLNAEYDALSKQADVLEAMGQNDRDKNSKVYGQYKAYSDALRKEADNLYRDGLNTESRHRLTDLKRRYNAEIVPIQNAWAKREKETDEQMKASLQNPSLMFTRTAADTSLEDYINNPTGGYGIINGANIAAQMAGMAKNLAKQIRSGAASKESIDPYTYNYIERYGLDENLIRNWQDSPTLKAMFEQVMKSNGVTEEALANSANAQSIIEKSLGYAEMGMWNALGEDKSHIIENYGSRLNAQADKELDVYRQKKVIDQQYAQEQAAANNRINPLALRSQIEISEKNKQIQEYINKKFVEQDPVTGQYRMTPKGWKEYRTMSANGDKKMALLAAGEASDSEAMEAARKMPNTVPTKFRVFMDEMNGGKSFVDAKGNALPGWGPNRAGNLFAKAIRDNEEGSYDTWHSTEYDRQLASTYGEAFKNQLMTAARIAGGKKVLDVVDFNGKNGWKNIDTMTAADLAGYKVTNVRYSRYGNTAILQKDGEEPIRVLLPPGITKWAEEKLNDNIQDADEYGIILYKGKRPMFDNNDEFLRDAQGNIMFTNEDLTPADRARIAIEQRKALNEMGSYGSQIVVPSETEHEKYSPFGL